MQTFFTPFVHFTILLCIVHCALSIANCAPCISHSALCIVHCALCALGVPPTATRDLAELAQAGAIVPMGDGPMTRYLLNHSAFTPGDEPIDGINEGINESILRLVRNHPGRGVPFFLASVKASRATVERSVRALVAAGKIEHRGSRKTGGYFAAQETPLLHPRGTPRSPSPGA